MKSFNKNDKTVDFAVDSGGDYGGDICSIKVEIWKNRSIKMEIKERGWSAPKKDIRTDDYF